MSVTAVTDRVSVLGFYRTTVGKKVVMAVTGLIWVGYVIVHMFGNLKLFEGPGTINAWGVFLREVGGPVFRNGSVLWAFRLVLIAALVLHVLAAFQISKLDLESRPVPYSARRDVQASFASRTMRWGGAAILLFIIYHLLHMTTGTVHPDFREGDIYHNLVTGLRVPLVALVYIAAMLALGLHLYHGVWSMFQTVGLNDERRTRLLRGLATVVAVGVAAGFVSLPLAILLGLVR
jgi:succinate dehydrogenase / fumarate reductase cytochrome b subunit